MSYFINTKSDALVIYESSRYGSKRLELRPVCIWYAGGILYSVTINLLNKYDNDGNIIVTDGTNKIATFEISVFEGVYNWCDGYRKAVLEVDCVSNKWKVEHFVRNLQFVSTKNALLIYYKDIRSEAVYSIIVRDNGVISLCERDDSYDICLTEHNILVRNFMYEGDITKCCDITGALLCYADRYSDYQIFRRVIKQPTRFNSSEIALHKSNLHSNLYKDEFDYLEGVIDPESGSVIIPPCFSKIQTHRSYNYFQYEQKNEIPQSAFISIVQIDNFVKGELTSYYGVYLDDKLILPISYSKIAFLTYKRPNNEEFMPTNMIDEKSHYLVLQQGDLWGIADIWGRVIMEPCATSVLLLEKNIQIQTTRGENSILHIPQYSAPEYVGLCKDNLYNLIYQDKVISDFIYSDLEIMSLYVRWDDELIFIKAKKNDKHRLIFMGKVITDYYKEIQAHISFFENGDTENTFVLTATDDSGNQGLLNNKGEIVIDFSPQTIIPYSNYIIVGTAFLVQRGNEIFNSIGYVLMDEKKGGGNEHLFCYSNKNEYVIIDGSGKVHKFNNSEKFDDKTFSVGYYCFTFNVEKGLFQEVESENECDDDYYQDYYEDKYNYEEDTYYALGGSDYDSFKKRGGSIDDMMDGMGL